MMVHFRKRFPVEQVAKINEFICTGVWPEGMRNVDRNDRYDMTRNPRAADPKRAKKLQCIEEKTNRKKKAGRNCGKLILNATVASTDIDLLDQCRRHLETAINLLWNHSHPTGHKLPYSRKHARKCYPSLAKAKKWTASKVRKATGEQLGWIARAWVRLNQLLQVPADLVKFFGRFWDPLSVVPLVFEQ